VWSNQESCHYKCKERRDGSQAQRPRGLSSCPELEEQGDYCAECEDQCSQTLQGIDDEPSAKIRRPRVASPDLLPQNVPRGQFHKGWVDGVLSAGVRKGEAASVSR
jgi:hypothetical protein